MRSDPRRANPRAAQLYAKYGPIIYARCRRMLRDPVAAEDATQEVFIRVLRHLAAAPSDPSVLPWLYRICGNYCLNMLRDRQRLVVALERFSGFATAPAVDPATRTEERQLAQRLVERADPEVARAAVLHHVAGYRQGEVAQKEGVCRRTVLYRLARFEAQAQAA